MYFLCIWTVGEDQRYLNWFLLTEDSKVHRKSWKKQGSRRTKNSIEKSIQKWSKYNHFFIPVVKTVVNWATSLVTPVFEKLFDRVLDPPSRENNLNTSGLLLRLKYIKNTQTIKNLTPRWKLFEKCQLFKKNYLSKPRICTLRGFTRSPPHVPACFQTICARKNFQSIKNRSALQRARTHNIPSFFGTSKL